MDVNPLGRSTSLVGGGNLQRFSSRLGRLSHVYLKDQLKGASEYRRIAGYFRSSIFDLINEEIEGIGTVRIVCNSDLDQLDIDAAQKAREQLLKEKWNDVDDAVESFFRRPRYQRLYEILTRGNVEIRVVSRKHAPFVHGKAGVIYRPDGTSSAFMGSLNETREGWSSNYEFVWEDTSADGVAWVEDEFEYLWDLGKPLPDAIIEEIGRSARRVEVQLADLKPSEVAPAALVEADIYRKGEELMPYIQAQAGLSLFRNVVKSVFGKEVQAYLPIRALPLSTTPPIDLAALFDMEATEIKKLLSPKTRKRTEAEAKLRSLAIVENSLSGKKTQPTIGELRRLASEIGSGKKRWNEIFPGVASVTLTAEGHGPSIDLRISKTGIPIQLVPEGTPGATVVAVKRVDDLGFYNLGRDQLAKKVGLSGPKTTAAIRFLKLKEDESCYKQITIGKSKFDRYSSKAIETVVDAMKTHSIDEIWKSHGNV